MSFTTLLRLNNKKFKQGSSDNLNLSGGTYIDGTLQVNTGGTFTFKDGNEAIDKVLLSSDINGKAKWGNLPEVSSIRKTIIQSAHGFQKGDYIGWGNDEYSKAIADNSYDGEFIGFVSDVINSNEFELTQAGYMSGFTNLETNNTYYLSDQTSGLIVTGKTEVVGHIIKPTMVAISATEGWVLPYIGSYVIETGDTITFTGSVIQSGSTVTLVGDVLNPSDGYYYGTDENGNKGWHVLPDPTIAVTAVTSNYNATVSDGIVVVDTSTASSNITVNLPTNDLEDGYRIFVKDGGGDASTYNIIVDAGSGNDIDGEQSGSIDTDFGSVELIYIGSNSWSVVSFTN
jgi:hypothetical protein